MPSLTDAADPVTRSPDESSSDAIPELVQLGARLGQARRERGLSREDLADRLRLGPDQLDALERGDRSGLREPVFVIALAKRVAGALGVDVQEEIASLRRSRFMAGSPPTRPVPLAPEASAPLSSGTPSAGGTARLLRFTPGRSLLLALGLLLLAGAIGLGGLLWSQARRAAQERPTPAVPVEPTPASQAAGQERVASDAEAAAEGGAAAVAPTTLLVQAMEPSWLEVRDAAGTTLFQGTLEGERRFPIGEGLKLLAGRPDQVKVGVGDEPPKVLGTIDDVNWQSFSLAPESP